MAQRWVNVEFLGGPRDGEVHVYPYPPPRDLCVPLRPLAGEWASEPAWVPRADVPMLRTGCYRATGRDADYEIVAVTDSRWGKLRAIMGGRRPMGYVWQGEE